MRSVFQKHSALLRQMSMFAICLCAVVTLFGVTDSAAYKMEDGDFSISYKTKYQSDPVEYQEVTVDAYNGQDADVVLPQTVTIDGDTVPVTSFKGSVFKNKGFVRSVTVPEGYTEVPSSAFENHSGLTSVSLPGSLTMVGSYAFKNCTALETVTFAEGSASGLKLRTSAFEGCTSLTSVALPARLSDLNDGNPFFGCTALKQLTVADSCQDLFSENNIIYQRNGDDTVTLIAYPSTLTPAELTVPAQVKGMAVTGIAPHAFRNNKTLESVTLPASVTRIERMAFKDCSNLMTVNVLSQEPLSLDSNCFTGMAEGSIIYIPNEAVKQSFIPADDYTYYYDDTTGLIVKEFTPEPPAAAAVEAGLSLTPAGRTPQGEVKFDLWVDSAANLSTMILTLSYDDQRLGQPVVAGVGDVFENVYSEIQTPGTLKIMCNQLSNKVGYSGAEKVKVATVTMPVLNKATGDMVLTLTEARISGITDPSAPAVKGEAVLNTASAAVTVPSFDLNGDEVIDQVDVTEAQRYYMAKSGDDNWEEAQKADVNGDNKVDLEDLIAIFHNITEF